MNFIVQKMTLSLKKAVFSYYTAENLDVSWLEDYTPAFEHPKNDSFGDYSSNISFDLVKLGFAEKISPFELAQKLVFALNLDKSIVGDDCLSRVEVAAGGFINFYFSESFLLDQSIKSLHLFDKKVQDEPHSFLVEFSSPNIAKPFTIGHLRSTVIGDSIAKLLEFSGNIVYRDNHLGDWGTQFGKQLYAISAWGDMKKIEVSTQPVKDLVELYVKFHEEAALDPSLDDKARALFLKMERKDQESLALWRFCVDVSMKEFSRIYLLLGIKFTENAGLGYGESYFEDKMPAVVEELKKKKIMRESEGAQVVFFSEEKFPPLLILKKDGSTLYATRDLATDKFRWDRYGHDLTIINEVGSEQSLYFQQLFEVEKMLGWTKDESKRVHVKHGLYRFGDRKMSTRKGDVIWLDDILNEAFSRVTEISEEGCSEEHLWKIALGAIKWNDLSKESVRDLNYNLDEILNLRGNSGPYMQYTFVRCFSILAKSVCTEPVQEVLLKNNDEKLLIDKVLSDFRVNFDNVILTDKVLSSSERSLITWLLRFDEARERATADYQVHILANYLYELATRFNSFYAQSEILGNNRSQLLTFQVAECLKVGLELMGIEVVARM